MPTDILFIMADQWAARQLGCYGSPVAGVSPALDALAAGGTRFARCITPSPVCCAARASILTGRSPAVHGVVCNNLELRPDCLTYAQVLRQRGYRTIGVGKFHHTAMPLPPPAAGGLDHLGWDEAVVHEDPRWGPWLDWVGSAHPALYDRALATCWGMPYAGRYGAEGRDLRPRWRAAVETHLRPLQAPPWGEVFHPSPLPLEAHPARWITDTAVARLEALAAARAAGDARPFHLFVSHVGPHDPYDPPAPYDRWFDPAALPPPLPRAWADDQVPPAMARFARDHFGLAGLDAAGWARLRALYFGACRLIDDEIGRLLAAVRRLGLERDLLVVFTTDHGDMAGDHGLLMKGPWHYDGCVRVPLIAAGAGVEAGRVEDRLVSLLDLFPTFAAVAGADPAGLPLEGHPLPLAAGAPGGHAELAVETNGTYGDDRVQARSVLTAEGARLTLFPGLPGTGQLFELAADPHEAHDRFRHAAWQPARCALGERLAAAQARQWLPPPARNRHPDVLHRDFGAPLHLARGWPTCS
ncbi:MAG: sulfatase-like hydrolase/transferase [Planctomycetes bacterium]|nr:sulfatase-like hydrolase/transferase [Planctomycetota bacterium]